MTRSAQRPYQFGPIGQRGRPDGNINPVTGDDLDPALAFHGDAEVAAGLVDLAVNVRSAPLPPWLDAPIRMAISDLSDYPDSSMARHPLAARHGRDPAEVLLTAGAAQAFTLIAQAYEYARRSPTGAPDRARSGGSG